MNLNIDNNNNSFFQKEKVLKERFQSESMSILERVDYYYVKIISLIKEQI